MSARSFFPLGLMPAATPPARIPGTALTPPSSHSISPNGTRSTSSRTGSRSWIHRRGRQPRPLVPAEHHVEILDTVGRAALAEVVDGGHAHGSTRPAIGHHGDVAVVRADHAAGRRPLALAVDAHERLA